MVLLWLVFLFLSLQILYSIHLHFFGWLLPSYLESECRCRRQQVVVSLYYGVLHSILSWNVFHYDSLCMIYNLFLHVGWLRGCSFFLSTVGLVLFVPTWLIPVALWRRIPWCWCSTLQYSFEWYWYNCRMRLQSPQKMFYFEGKHLQLWAYLHNCVR